jgi:hypothetical protein
MLLQPTDIHATDIHATNPTLRCICDSPNYQIGDQDWDSPHVLTIGNVTDGILDEAGFTYAHGYLGPGGKENMAVMAYKNWKNVIYFMLNLQSHGKGYYSINEYGGKLTSGNVSYRYAMTAAIPMVVRQFVIASCESVCDVPLLLPRDATSTFAAMSHPHPTSEDLTPARTFRPHGQAAGSRRRALLHPVLRHRRVVRRVCGRRWPSVGLADLV